MKFTPSNNRSTNRIILYTTRMHSVFSQEHVLRRCESNTEQEIVPTLVTEMMFNKDEGLWSLCCTDVQELIYRISLNTARVSI